MSDDIEMPEPKDSGSDSGGGDDDESNIEEDELMPVSDEELAKLERAVNENALDYDSHKALIDGLKAAGELEKLSEARQRFAGCFPLSPSLWLAWIRDEMAYGAGHPEEEGDSGTAAWQQSIVSLFERAVDDYVSVDVWVEYIQFAIGHRDALNADIVTLCERSVAACGHHFVKGSLVWQLYQLVISAVKNDPQLSKCVYERQLRTPMMGVEEAYDEYTAAFGEPPADVKSAYLHIRADEDRMFAHEKALESVNEQSHGMEVRKDGVQVFGLYIADEQRQEGGRPEHVANLYERAVNIAPLTVQLWLDYAKWTVFTLKDNHAALRVYWRAARNCTWSPQLHERLLVMSELTGADEARLTELWDKALACCQPSTGLWLSYIGVRRRLLEAQLQATGTIDYRGIGEWYELGMESLKAGLGERDWDAKGHYRLAWAVFLATKLNDIQSARAKLSELRALCSQFACFWERWMWLERGFGDTDNCRKVLCEGIKKARDDPRGLMQLLEQLERDEGTAETVHRANMLLDNKTKNLAPVHTPPGGKDKGRPARNKPDMNDKKQNKGGNDKKEKKNFNDKTEKKNFNKDEKKKSPNAKKANAPAPPVAADTKPIVAVNGEAKPTNMDSDGLKPPSLPPPKALKRKAPVDSSDDSKVAKTTAQSTQQHDQTASTSEQTEDEEKLCVFVSNLEFSITEESVREFFADVGEVDVVAFAGHHGRLHRGFGHVRFKTPEAVKAALAKDRQHIDKRPVFVSPYRKSSDEREKKFDYSTGLEKRKLFVRGLAAAVTEADLRELFGEFGRVRAVRLVTYRSGASKGMAYVEFEDEKQAKTALVAVDQKPYKNGKPLSVAISNPPARKAPPPNPKTTALGSTFGQATDPNQRKSHSSKLQLMQPRAMSVKADAATKDSNDSATSSAAPPASAAKLSNQQFRELMMKK